MMQPIYEDAVVRQDEANEFPNQMSGPARADPGYRPKHVNVPSRSSPFITSIDTNLAAMNVQLATPRHPSGIDVGHSNSMYYSSNPDATFSTSPSTSSRAPSSAQLGSIIVSPSTASSSIPTSYRANHGGSDHVSASFASPLYEGSANSSMNTGSTPSGSTMMLLPPPSPYESSSQYQLPYDWNYNHAHHHQQQQQPSSHLSQHHQQSPYTTPFSVSNISPSVDTSAFLVSPISAEETPTMTSTTSPLFNNGFDRQPGMSGNMMQTNDHHQHGSRGDASTDVMMDHFNPGAMGFGQGLDQNVTGLGLGGINPTAGPSTSISHHQQPTHQFDQPMYDQTFSGMIGSHSTWQMGQDGLLSSGQGSSGMEYSQQDAHMQYQSQPQQPPSNNLPQGYSRQPMSKHQESSSRKPGSTTPSSQHHSKAHPQPYPTTQDSSMMMPAGPPLQPGPYPHPSLYSAPAGHRPLFPIAGTSIDIPTSFYIQGYLSAPNRYAFGERKLVIHSPRVGQKSYGTEKRFICPPPVAVMSGRTWWTKRGPTLQAAPTVNISITDETRAPDVRPNWLTTHNRLLEEPTDQSFTKGEAPFVGKACGKSLHIADSAARKAKAAVHATVTIMAAAAESSGSAERKTVVGTFDSKPITIVSKPSKKRQNSRNSELFLQHGTAVSLYNRIRSQTSSTKFLAVATDITRQLGSDGKPMPLPADLNRTDPHFIADQMSWDPLLIWLVDPFAHDRPRPMMTGREAWEGFPPPPDVIPAMDMLPPPVICYNNTIRLQCPATGLTSPVMVIRRVDNGTTAYGGESIRREGSLGKCPIGEHTGEPISQLHKIALELYATPNLPNLPVYGNDFRYSGQWLTTEKDSVEYRLGKTARTFAPEEPSPVVRSRPNSASSVPSSPNVNIGSLKPLTPRVKPGPLTPTSSSAGLPSPYMAANAEFPAQMARQPQATQGFSGAGTPYGVPNSPSWETRTELNGPGPMRRRRTSSNASVSSKNSGGLALGLKGAIMSPPAPPTVIRSVSGEIAQSAESSRWYVELAETATWTIVGAETKVYTFWVNSEMPTGTPVTPLPVVERCIPPGVKHDTRGHRGISTLSTLPMATLYGHHFTKDTEGNPVYHVWWGSQPAEENEFKCPDVMTAAVPRRDNPQTGAITPISLVRQDGMVVLPTGHIWTEPSDTSTEV